MNWFSRCGNGRIMYDPSWSKSMPYCTFAYGSAERCFSSFGEAVNYMRDRWNIVIYESDTNPPVIQQVFKC